MVKDPLLKKANSSSVSGYWLLTTSYRFWIVRQFFCQVQSGPPSSKTQCLKKRKPALTRSTWGQPLASLNVPKLHMYHAGDA